MAPRATPRAARDEGDPDQAEPVRIPKRAARAERTSEVVASSIRREIVQGDLRAGDRLPPEDELMEVLGIARTTLREAMRILEVEGLITVLRGRNGGARVTRPTVESMTRVFTTLLQVEGVPMADLYDALSVIEPTLVGRLATRRDPVALAELRVVIDRAAAVAGDEDGSAFGEAAAAVHETIFKHGGNASLSIFAQLLREVLTQVYRRSGRITSPTERRRAIRSYRKVYRLMESGDAPGAQEHWQLQMTYPSRRAQELGTP